MAQIAAIGKNIGRKAAAVRASREWLRGFWTSAGSVPSPVRPLTYQSEVTALNMKYPVLMCEINKRKIDKKAVAESLHISSEELESRLAGTESFTWDEAVQIRRYFFSDINKTELFRQADDS